jgi:hypothetical protein
MLAVLKLELEVSLGCRRQGYFVFCDEAPVLIATCLDAMLAAAAAAGPPAHP